MIMVPLTHRSLRTEPRARAARYDRRTGRIAVGTSSAGKKALMQEDIREPIESFFMRPARDYFRLATHAHPGTFGLFCLLEK